MTTTSSPVVSRRMPEQSDPSKERSARFIVQNQRERERVVNPGVREGEQECAEAEEERKERGRADLSTNCYSGVDGTIQAGPQKLAHIAQSPPRSKRPSVDMQDYSATRNSSSQFSVSPSFYAQCHFCPLCRRSRRRKNVWMMTGDRKTRVSSCGVR